MITYKHLFPILLSEENVRNAIVDVHRSHSHDSRMLEIITQMDEFIPKFILMAKHFENDEHYPIQINDGITRKVRTIIGPSIREQVIHHMIVNVLKPIIMKSLYPLSLGSIPGGGCHKGMKFIRRWIKHDAGNVKYCLKMDIRKFFDSVDHDILKTFIATKIKDRSMLRLLFTVIDVVDTGLPLGFYTSQWFANWFLSDLDHYIKEVLKAPHYVRYMDDMVIFGPNKRKLHKMRERISDYLNNLGLEMKSNYQVFRFEYIDKNTGKKRGRALDFLGFEFHRNSVILRKNIMLKISRKAKKVSKKVRATLFDCRQLVSYNGWLNASDTHGLYINYIDPYVDMEECKNIISRHDRYMARQKLKLQNKISECYQVIN